MREKVLGLWRRLSRALGIGIRSKPVPRRPLRARVLNPGVNRDAGYRDVGFAEMDRADAARWARVGMAPPGYTLGHGLRK